MLVDWGPGPALTKPCPLCGADGGKPHRLVAWDRVVDGTPHRLYGCPACGSAFFDPLPAAHYEEPADAAGAVKFYVEQGAGLDVMLEPTAILDRLPVRRYLEIGCGFGFSLDYAQRARGWSVCGYDPGLLAQAGRPALGLDIRSAYFSADTPLDEGTWDAVLCSEVLEHVHDPHAFLAMVRRALAPGGVLVLTTPNAAGIAPDTDLGALLPLLSAGFHTLLFSADALRGALRRAGFAHVRVGGSPHQLQAAASNRPLPEPVPFDRAAYRGYLAGRAALHEAGTPLGTGFRYRLLKELVNAGQYEAATAPLAALQRSWAEVYGIDLAVPETIGIPEPGALDFEALARRFPLNLCGVLYARGIAQMNASSDAAGAARSFGAAAAFAAALRAALQAIGTDDGETADLGAQALCEQVQALARVDPTAAVRHFAYLSAAQGGGGTLSLPAALVAQTRRRLVVALVNTGAYEAAEALIEEGDDDPPVPHAAPGAAPGAAPDAVGAIAFADRLSLVFVLGMLKLNHRADHGGAAQAFQRVFAACRACADQPAARTLLWPARYHEALALSHAAKTGLAQNAALDLLAPVPAGAPEVPAPYRAWAKQLLGA